MAYLLDTNICIAFLNKKDSKVAALLKQKEPSDFVLCSVVKAELLFGARYSQQVEKNLQLLEQFFSQFESLLFDDKAAEYYGVTRAILTKAGTPIGANDLTIASIALANNCTIVTRNASEFKRVPGLRIEEW